MSGYERGGVIRGDISVTYRLADDECVLAPPTNGRLICQRADERHDCPRKPTDHTDCPHVPGVDPWGLAGAA